MRNYEHTQPGTVVRFSLGLCLIVFAVLACVLLTVGGEPTTGVSFVAAAAIMLVCLLLFHSLHVRVSRRDILVSFGIGLVRKRLVVDEIKNAEVVRNRWHHGWGIKKIPGGWLYNVSGFDAVEIELANGKRMRIGTDEPKKLASAIESVTGRKAG